MDKVKLALAMLVSLPAVLILTVACGLYSLMVGIFYLVQKPLAILFSTDKLPVQNVPSQYQHLKHTSQTAISQG